MDGNGRWAKKRLLPRTVGHREGVKTLEKIVEAIYNLNVSCFTVYAFSTENKERPEKEVKNLVKLIREFFSKSIKKFIKNQIRIIVIGDKSFFESDIQDIMQKAEYDTKDFLDKTFVLALNYGARGEIVRAVNTVIEKGERVTEQNFGAFLDTKKVADPDIIIRTGGDMRLSNFLLYQAAYSELFFSNELWPDFSIEHIKNIIEQFNARTRKFGKIK